MPIELFIVSALRAIIEVTMFVLIGQGILALLAGSRRHENFVYRLFQILTNPVVKTARVLTPRLIPDAHVPLVAFFLIFWLWLGLAYYKRYLCVAGNLAC